VAQIKPHPQPVADRAAGHAAGAQFVDHRHLAERDLFEQHFDVRQVVQIGAIGAQPGAGGFEALAHVGPLVHELASARAVELGRVGVERPVEVGVGARKCRRGQEAARGLRITKLTYSEPWPRLADFNV
jgi:hypothetical protein